LCPSGFVTTTLTVPAACAGAVQVTAVELTNAMLVADVLPKVMLLGVARKFVPATVTLLPPEAGPLLGEQPVTVGAGAGVYVTVMVTTSMSASTLSAGPVVCALT